MAFQVISGPSVPPFDQGSTDPFKSDQNDPFPVNMGVGFIFHKSMHDSKFPVVSQHQSALKCIVWISLREKSLEVGFNMNHDWIFS